MPEQKPGDSQEQQEAEPDLIAWLSEELGVKLDPRSLPTGPASRVQVDGVSDDPPILVEASAHQGPPKPGQMHKIMSDAFKLLAVDRHMDESPRLILLFADKAAAKPFQSGTWRAEAITQAGIEIHVAELAAGVRQRISDAQSRQYR